MGPNWPTPDTAVLLRYICVVGLRNKLPPLTVRQWLGASAGVVILSAALALVVSQVAHHPKVTRQQAIQAALRYGNGQSYPRVEAKYMRYSDLAKGASRDFLQGANTRDYFVWVVAVSGHYAISPLGTTTWGVAVVEDEAWTATSPVFEGGIKGDWPPFFDGLPDLAKDQN
jgi:hypothetical protein